MVRLAPNCEGVDRVTHELARDIVMVGRALLNEIVIEHPIVSAQHVVLFRVCALLFADEFKFSKRDTDQ